MELPPRARRIPQAQTTNLLLEGTTSACAENTFPSTIEFSVNRNYLRVRGEYRTAWGGAVRYSELPPRARRIPADEILQAPIVGTTSACAENTLRTLSTRESCWNYLRVRGEYGYPNNTKYARVELPPRARRILFPICVSDSTIGTTSACAENTWASTLSTPKARNYLRVRGEYFEHTHGRGCTKELPPRARRIRGSVIKQRGVYGTTSACAENTIIWRLMNRLIGNYLRVRGEYRAFPYGIIWAWELPPRARRIPVRYTPHH